MIHTMIYPHLRSLQININLSVDKKRFYSDPILKNYGNDVEILMATGNAYKVKSRYLEAYSAYSQARKFSFLGDKNAIEKELNNIEKSYRYRMQLGSDKILNLNPLVYLGIGTVVTLGIAAGLLSIFHDEAGLVALWSPYWISFCCNQDSVNFQQDLKNPA